MFNGVNKLPAKEINDLYSYIHKFNTHKITHTLDYIHPYKCQMDSVVMVQTNAYSKSFVSTKNRPVRVFRRIQDCK